MRLVELWNYEKLFWKRVRDDTKKYVLDHLVMELSLPVISFFIGYFANDQNAWTGLRSAIGALVIVGIIVMLKNLVVAGPKLYADKVSEMSLLSNDKAVLEKKLEPRLKIRHGTDEAFSEIRKGPGASTRIHRIEVKNESTVTTVRNVKVQLEYIDPNSASLPVSIIEMNDKKDTNGHYREEFNFNPGERRYFNVVGKHEWKDSTVFVTYAVPPLHKALPDGAYEIGILVTGENALPQRLVLKAWTEQGKLCVEEKL